jgi:MarR family transcriptional regulator, organic hydroperoxide resistance regulator
MKKNYRSGGNLINQISRSCGRLFKKILDDAGIGYLTEGQGRVIYALHEAPATGLSCRELGKAAGFDKATLSGILDRMEQSGLVVRIPSSGDRRCIFVMPGPSFPEDIGSKFNRVSSRMTELLYGDMTEEERNMTDTLLARLLENCRNAEENDEK